MTKHTKTAVVLLWSLLLLGQYVYAQNPQRQYKSHRSTQNTLNIQTNDGVLSLRAFTPYIIEVSFEKKGFQNPDSSHAVVLQPQGTKISLKNTSQTLEWSTSALKVIIQKTPFQLKFYRGKQLITSEAAGYFETKGKQGYLKGFAFNLDKKEQLFGTGERALPMNRRGYRLELYNKAHYAYSNQSKLMGYNIPLVLSSKKYSIYFDNAPKGVIDLGKTNPNQLTFESIGGKMTYYLIAAPTLTQVVEHYTALTGRQPLPPRWALGNIATRYGYRNEAQVRKVVKAYQAKDFPLDAVILDHYWYGKGEIKQSVAMGDFDWYTPHWKSGAGLVTDLQKQNIHTVLITQPFVLTDSKNFGHISKAGLLTKDKQGKPFIIPDFYFGKTGLLDIFQSATQQWFWAQYKKHIDTGVHGWWGDLGEPEMHPAGMRHTQGKADEVHNIYGHYWAKLIAEGYQKEYSRIRPFILMRAGFAGSQRFGLIPWSGDVSRTWGGLQSQIPLTLNMGLAGVGYMHSDLGGFAEGKLSPELYTRWLQYGVFQPIYRPHSQEAVPSEPIYYADSTQKIVREFIKLRYQMLPYNYTLAYENATKGTPLMRPLFFLEPNNAQLYQENKNYLWGNDFLVAPVLQKGQTKVQVYFPKGYNWTDFWSNKVYKGGTTTTIAVTPDKIPVFVRGGAFVPMVAHLSNTSAYSSENLIIHYYFDKDLKGEQDGQMYEDDGKDAEALKRKKYELLEFEAEQEAGHYEIEFNRSKHRYPNAPKHRKVTLVIHHKKFTTIKKAEKIDKKSITLSYDATKNQTTITFVWKKRKAQLFLN
ncbi:glycoside hydrolase family 31 protein [Microscilla marina]|uniref:Glycosyl hydrolase, family 31 n=1 Tax=Microscilla marina ATCC 23134 TaxID=313606 RepID=A1ZKD2_MICM2|nr:TIM-barrel domain-containing protein [Microscilla marina]EAY29158.1 glycosyl hydrolase, family 31 [Microscilla marina ATCC 23134]